MQKKDGESMLVGSVGGGGIGNERAWFATDLEQEKEPGGVRLEGVEC